MARVCMFCESPGPLSNEDVIPRWLLAEVKANGQRAPSADFSYDVLRRNHKYPFNVQETTRPLSPHGVLISRKVCQACNNGWMGAGLESPFSAVFRAMVHGRLREIAHPDMGLLTARWVLKTCMLFDQSIGEKYYYSQEDRDLVMKGQLPANTDIRMGAVKGTTTGVESAVMLMNSENDPESLGTVEVLYAGPLAFMVTRAERGNDFLQLLTDTYHFAKSWIPIHSILPLDGSPSLLTVRGISDFLDDPYGATKG